MSAAASQLESPKPLGSPADLALKLGSVQLQTNLLLAPIAGYCDLAFRLTCRAFNDDAHAAPGFDGRPAGLGLACTDLLSPQGLLRGTAASLDLARTNDEDKPVGMQLYGSDPAIMAEGAKWAVEHGATVVDINMGCPVDKVTKKDGGSKLMVPDEGIDASSCRSFSRAVSIVRAIRAQLPEGVPLTAKMRLGWRCSDDAPKLAAALVDEGVCGITVHGRTTEQKFRGEADLSGIARVVEAIGDRAPVIGNGDVKTAADAARMMRQTGCRGVMIGRGALSTPWIFRDAWSLMTTGRVGAEPSLVDKIGTVRGFFELMVRFRDERYAVMQLNRRISWFAKRMGDPYGGGSNKAFREAVRTARTAGQMRSELDRAEEAARKIADSECNRSGSAEYYVA